MKKIIISILFFIIIIILILLNIIKYRDKDRNFKSISQNEKSILTEEFIIEKKPDIKKNTILEYYNGFEVSSKIIIPKINLESVVLENYSEKALKICITKFWGADANEVGNFCIAGHNFKNKKMFHDLKNLQVNDTFYIEDNKNGKHKYQIYDIYRVYPDETKCLSQNTNGTREVTLITCTFDSVKRIIVKAKEI